jgi:hypothetical protein
MACKDKDSTSDLKQAKTTREAIQAINGVEYRLVKVLPVYRNIKLLILVMLNFWIWTLKTSTILKMLLLVVK